MSRSGAEALGLYAQANAKCREAEVSGNKSRALPLNWSAILLREARERGGPPDLWESARRQCAEADAIEPGYGAYNLACIAANLGNDDDVRKHLLQSAEFGHILPRSQILRDVNFEGMREESWFSTLLDNIFNSELTPTVG
jgi:hypothetical protein